jgi:hypothetical protein
LLNDSDSAVKDQLIDSSDSESVSGDDESGKYGGQILISDEMVEAVKETLTHNEPTNIVVEHISQEPPVLPKPPNPSKRKITKYEGNARAEKRGNGRNLLASKSSKVLPATTTKAVSIEDIDPKNRRRKTYPNKQTSEAPSLKDEEGSSIDDHGTSGAHQEIESIKLIEDDPTEPSLESKSMAALKTIRKLKEGKIARSESQVEVESNSNEQLKNEDETSFVQDLQNQDDDGIDNYRDFLSSESEDEEDRTTILRETGANRLESTIDVDTHFESKNIAEVENELVDKVVDGGFTGGIVNVESSNVTDSDVLEINEPIHVFHKENGTYQFNFEPENLPGLFCWKLVSRLNG